MILAPVKEIDIYGVFMPALLLWAALSVFGVKLIHRTLARRGFYRSDLEQQLFDTSLFFILTGLFTFVI